MSDKETVALKTIHLTAAAPAPDVAIQEPAIMRKGVYLTLQTLGNVDRGKKMELLPLDIQEYELVDDPSGIVLTYSAGRLLHGLLGIYESTGTSESGSYRGHFTAYEEYERKDKAGKLTLHRQALPGLYVSEPELLEAYGVGKSDNGRFSHAQRDMVLNALDELATKKQSILYSRKEAGGKRPTIRVTTPLISVMQIREYEDIADVRSGGDPRANWYKITPASILDDMLPTFHFRSLVALYPLIDDALEKIRGTRRGRKGSYHALFIDFLQTQQLEEIRIELNNLATKLRLGYMAKNRRTSDMERAVLEAAEVAYMLHYLLEPMQIAVNSAGRAICYIRPNPDMCSRLARSLEKRSTK